MSCYASIPKIRKPLAPALHTSSPPMYVELHARSAFSFLEGASLPEDLVALATVHQMPSMALLDRDGLYGAARFHLAAAKANLRAHIGAEIRYDVAGFSNHRPAGFKQPSRRVSRTIPHSDHPTSAPRLPLLVSSRVGYQNLCRLITRMKLR